MLHRWAGKTGWLDIGATEKEMAAKVRCSNSRDSLYMSDDMWYIARSMERDLMKARH